MAYHKRTQSKAVPFIAKEGDVLQEVYKTLSLRRRITLKTTKKAPEVSRAFCKGCLRLECLLQAYDAAVFDLHKAQRKFFKREHGTLSFVG